MLKALELLRMCQYVDNPFEFISKELAKAIEELEELQNRSCSSCKFNSNIYPRNEIVSCDKHRRFLNQHEYKYCGCYERK